MDDQQRVCKTCGSSNFGPSGRCRPCRAAAASKRMQDPDVRERAKAAGRRFCAKSETKAKLRERRITDPDFRERHRQYVAKYREKPETKAKWDAPQAKATRNARARAYWNQPDNKARREVWLKEYSAKPEIKTRKAVYEREQRKTKEYRAWLKEYTAKRFASSVQLRIHSAMTGRINKSLHQSKGGRSWEMLVGYTREDLVRHLERGFEKGMTWDNYGRGEGRRWEIDHIVPVVAFVFEAPEDIEFQRCWSLANLRPLWSAENRKKNGRRTHLI